MPTSEESSLLYRVARALLEDRDYGELLANLLDRTIESLGADLRGNQYLLTARARLR